MEERVKILCENALTSDFSAATVVYLYLSPSGIKIHYDMCNIKLIRP